MPESLLLIDVGNTRIKWATAADAIGRFGVSGAVATTEVGRVSESVPAGVEVERALVSNVAGPELARALGDAIAARWPQARIEFFVSSACCAGVRNGYRQASTLGCDRFAAAIGAVCLHPDRPLVVATCGTATTIDCIDAGGTFKGGMILPGVSLMARSLSDHTAQLPHLDALALAEQDVADNTEDAIALGCLTAQAGAIEHVMARAPGATLILSGGAAPLVGPLLNVSFVLQDNLVLVGLQAAARERTD